MTIPQALSEAARRHAGRPALIGHRVALTHAELEGCIGRAAADLASRGVRPGDVVGVSMASSPLHLVTLLALARAGACSVHVQPEMPRAAREAMTAQFGVGAVIGEPGGRSRLKADPAWLKPEKAAARADRSTPDAPWRLALSSGTTGLQKAIRVTHAMAAAEAAAWFVCGPLAGDDRFLCHRGLDSNWGLMTALTHLVAGAAVVFPRSLGPEHYVEAIRQHGVTQLIMAPALLHELTRHLPAGGGGLPSVRVALASGSALPPQVVAAALERVSNNIATGYGASELGLVAFAGRDVLQRAPLSVGPLRVGFEAEVVDRSGARVAPGVPGILRFRRAGMAHEYYRNPEATARGYRDGWFYPGDHGRIDAGGLLYIEGRLDDKLNLGGRKVEPLPIERALEEHPAVAEAAAFAAAPGGVARLYAAVVLRSPADEKMLIAHCRARIGAGFTPARVFFARKLPRNEGGKLLRTALARRVRRPAPGS